MANPVYPTLAIAGDSEFVLRDGRSEDIGSDGTSRVRKLYADKFDFTIHHPSLNSTDATTLKSFITTNPLATIDFTSPLDSVVYQVKFGSPAYRLKWVSPTRVDYWVRLLGQ